MKNKNMKKKVFSAIAVLAMSATAIGGALSFAACGDKSYKSVDTTVNGNANTSVISTAKGVVKNQTSGTTYYAGKPKTENTTGSGTKEDPYDIGTLLASQDILKPGDTVLIMPGTYNIATTIAVKASGAYNKYISVLNAAYVEGEYEGENKEVILDFSTQNFASTSRGVQIYGNYIYWYGIDICGAGDNGMYIAGNYNTVEYCEFYNNRDSGLQLGRAYSENTVIDQWPNYNLVKNCTSHNNYDNETYGENADGFAAKLTVGYGNVFDGCIAYRNSDDGWDLYAKVESGNIGAVIMYNCVAFENGYLEYTQRECNKLYPTWNGDKTEADNKDGENKYGLDSYQTRDGDGNGFKLGGSVMEGDVVLYNCLSFANRMHGVTDNSNPGVLAIEGVTSYNNSAAVDNNPESANFGQIAAIKNVENHGNVDVARQTYSYNNLKRVLSVSDEIAIQSLASDEYRGAVTDSILIGANGTKSNVISGSIDADTRNGGTSYTKQIAALDSSEVFIELPIVKTVTGEGAEAVTSYTYNLSGLDDLYTDDAMTALNPNRVHLKYRNADDSINMKNILALEDGWDSGLDIAGKGLGSVLNLESWDAYEHFFANDFTDANAESENAAIVARTKESLTLNCDTQAVYQDFDVPSKMISCTITWESSDESLLKVGTDKDISVSLSEYVMVEVYRPSKKDGDKKVNLTATITCGSGDSAVSDTKTFEITIKAGDPILGDVYVRTQDGDILLEGYSIIIDRFKVFREPEVLVENGLDYNGKLLSKDQFNVKTTYLYATDSNSPSVEVKNFTPSNAGVYTIKHTVSLVSDHSKTAGMSYRIFVASATAQVDFSGEPSVIVNRDGYAISGAVSSATGSLYAVSSATPLDVTAENIKSLSGVVSQNFKGESINMQFANDNTAEYYIYYALGNAHGDITSGIYEKKVDVVSISTAEQFMKVAGGEPLGEEISSTSIYVLANDIDFSGVSYKVGEKPFTGLLNGKGHTVSNVTVDTGSKNNASIFYRVTGGTIENIKFNNIKINGAQEVGIVSQARGGYFYNIAITNIRVTGTQRVSALIGRVFEGEVPVYIEQVSVNNPIPEVNEAGALVNETNEEYIIKSSANRASGIIGLVQTNQSMTSDVKIYINNCYVSSYIYCGTYSASSIVAEYQDSYGGTEYDHVLEITGCVSASVIVSGGSSSRLGGIVGYQTGADVLKITNCLSIGKFYYSGVEVLACQKNLSGIMGNYNSAAPTVVRNCAAMMQEHNSNYDVMVIESRSSVIYYDNLLDKDYWTFIYEDGTTSALKAPYVSLNFLGEWN